MIDFQAKFVAFAKPSRGMSQEFLVGFGKYSLRGGVVDGDDAQLSVVAKTEERVPTDTFCRGPDPAAGLQFGELFECDLYLPRTNDR